MYNVVVVAITKNIHGKIRVNNLVIAKVAGFAARQCYGVVEIGRQKRKSAIRELFKKKPEFSKGTQVVSLGDKISLSLSVVFKYGVSIEAVIENIKESVKYTVEKFTGMLVSNININVVGVS